MTDKTLTYEFAKGLWDENPVFRQLLGMCPTLAVTNSGINGLAMGLAVIFVLTCSSTIISLFRKFIPSTVRIPCFIIVISTFVTMVDLFMKAKFPEISKTMGPFIPLIVVNCLILGRAEAFASKNKVFPSIIDALGMGVGFTLTLTALGSVREIIGSGSIFTVQILGSWFPKWVIMNLPAGAFLTLGLMLGSLNYIAQLQKNRNAK